MKRKIETRIINPPIPVRCFDWCAFEEGYEPGRPIGHGATEREAVEDLLEKVVEDT